MVTNAEAPSGPQPTREQIAERISALREDAARAGRTLLTGDANGRARRNVLFVATVALIVAGLPLLALLPLFLLALTDMVIV